MSGLKTVENPVEKKTSVGAQIATVLVTALLVAGGTKTTVETTINNELKQREVAAHHESWKVDSIPQKAILNWDDIKLTKEVIKGDTVITARDTIGKRIDIAPARVERMPRKWVDTALTEAGHVYKITLEDTTSGKVLFVGHDTPGDSCEKIVKVQFMKQGGFVDTLPIVPEGE